MRQFARLAYEAYKEAAKGFSYDGVKLKEWYELDEKIKEQWFAVIQKLYDIDFRIVKKSTGRTTRMCYEALKQAKLGKDVYVVFHNKEFGETLYIFLMESNHKITILDMWDDSIDYKQLKIRNTQPYTSMFFFDHYVLELKFDYILNEFFRY